MDDCCYTGSRYTLELYNVTLEMEDKMLEPNVAKVNIIAASGTASTVIADAIGNHTFQDWSYFVAIVVGTLTALYTAVNLAYLLRTWWLKEIGYRKQGRPSSGFVPLDDKE